MNGSYMNEFGQHAPGPSRQRSVASPVHQMSAPMQPAPSPFNAFALPSPCMNATDVTIFQEGQQFASPAQMTTSPAFSPYPQRRPIPTPQHTSSTEYLERSFDPQPPLESADYEEFLEWKRQKHEARELREQALQNQHRQQSPYMGYPDTAGQIQARAMREQPVPNQSMQQSPHQEFSDGAGQVLQRPPMHMQPIHQNDSNYGFPYENLGQAHGLPGQGQQPVVARPNGHYYGTVDVKGSARVIRGNVLDSMRPNMRTRNHDYGGVMRVGENAKVWDGDQTEDAAKFFWNSQQ